MSKLFWRVKKVFFQNNKGFTLFEVVIVIVILSVVISIGGVLLGVGFKGGFASKNSIYSASIGRVALKRMAADINNVHNASASGLTLGTNSFTFVLSDGNSVSYYLSGTDLMRNSKVLANDISALSFAYYDQVFSSTAIPANVRCIAINLTVSYQSNTNNLVTMVCPRNFAL